MAFGEGVKTTDDMIPDVAQQPEVMQAAVEAGRFLGDRLRHDHDRRKAAAAMQKKMMEMMAHSA